MALNMSAQDFHGVTVSGTGNRYKIVNYSTKPLVCYAIQSRTDRIDLGSWAAGKPLQPGEAQSIAMFSRPVSTAGTVHTVPANNEKPIGSELRAVLFSDGTFYGPDDVFADFSRQINTARNFARDIQNLEDKRSALKQHEFMQAIRQINGSEASTDVEALVNRADVAFEILRIWNTKGEQDAEAALARIAGLPDVTKGE